MNIVSKHKIIFFTVLMMIVFNVSKSSAQNILIFNLSNIKKNSGKIIVEIYNDKTKWLKTPFQKLDLGTNQNIQTAIFKISYGKYAVTVYQDINSNGEADMNFIQIPKEPIGFGNNYKPFGEPKFESCLINFSTTSKTHEIKLYTVF